MPVGHSSVGISKSRRPANATLSSAALANITNTAHTHPTARQPRRAPPSQNGLHCLRLTPIRPWPSMEAWAEHASGPPSQLGAERWEWSDGAPSAGQAVDADFFRFKLLQGYFARSITSTNRQHLRLLNGRVSMMRTVSPMLQVSASSCAMNLLVFLTNFPYLACFSLRSTVTVMLLVMELDVTTPIRSLRRLRSNGVLSVLMSSRSYVHSVQSTSAQHHASCI